MANERIPTQKGRQIKNETIVFIGGKSFDGWEQVTVVKSIEAIAHQFTITFFDKFFGLRQQWPIKPGVATSLNLGKTKVSTGYVDRLNVVYNDEGRSFTMSGRSKAGDLIDCGWTGENEYTNINLVEFAKILCAPFGINVLTSVEPGLVDKVSIKPGESIFEVLNRQARLQGYLWVSTPGGNIRLTRAARARSSTGLEQGVNILSANASYDNSQRFSTYQVKGQSIGLDNFFGEEVSGPLGEAKDAGVTRTRPLVVLADGNVDAAKAKTRAEWEASSRLGKSIRITADVQGWSKKDGELWDVNQLVSFKSQFLGVNQDMLIAGVTQSDSKREGKTTQLTLVDKQAFTPAPTVNQNTQDDVFSALGANF